MNFPLHRKTPFLSLLDPSTQEPQQFSGIHSVYHAFTPRHRHTHSIPNSSIPSLTLGYVCTEVPIIPDNWSCMPPRGCKKLFLVPGSLAMQGAQALIGMKAMKTQEEQMPAQPCTSADTFHAKPLHRHHRIWTRINDSESLFLFIQVHVAVSFCTEKQVPVIASEGLKENIYS